jgi:flavin-dependent dehydrogenase
MPLLADVGVVGGGPAGAAAARLLASWGHAVVVLSRPTRQVALAESLPPSCIKLFDELGVRAAVDRAGFVRATGNTVQWADHDRRVEMFEPGALGYQVARDRFDALLLDAAQAEGAAVNREASVRDVSREGDLWRLTFDHGAGSEVLRVRWVLDCSGRAGVLGRAWRETQSAARTIAVVGMWDRPDRWSLEDDTHTFVESYANGWAWSVPVSTHRRFVTVMVDPQVTALTGRAEMQAAYDNELRRTIALRSLVSGAMRGGAAWACDATPYSSSSVFDDGLLLVGDAASFVDPLSSFGVKKALASAWLASVVVHTALTDSATVSSALQLFADRERSMYEGLRRGSAALSREAAGAHATPFWSSRADAELDGGGDEWDVGELRADVRVREAFETIKARPTLKLRLRPAVRMIRRAMVRDRRVVLEDHLAAPTSPHGVRYCRNIDLVLLTRLAPQFDQVPDLYEAYNRAAPPAPLPDFLGALSALVGRGVLDFV